MFDQFMSAGMTTAAVATALAILTKGIAEVVKALAAWRAAGRKPPPAAEHQTITRSSLPPPDAEEMAGVWKVVQKLEGDHRVLKTRQDSFEKTQDRILRRLNGSHT